MNMTKKAQQLTELAWGYGASLVQDKMFYLHIISKTSTKDAAPGSGLHHLYTQVCKYNNRVDNFSYPDYWERGRRS